MNSRPQRDRRSTLIRTPELLAPAGSPEALRAAIAAGADAVYLSGKRFGARKFATNFDEPELQQAIDYAHLRGVKVYVTVNTLIRDDELAEIGEFILRIYEMGADAVLVQDLGVAALARQIVPDLNLHASTQMTIHSREGAAWAARNGFKRVVLAREVSLKEIEKMKDIGIGLEVFVHGALCYSYSGQCLLSSAIGGRSGNRGMCAQPCRKPYVLLKGERDEYGRPKNLVAVPIKEKFLISTRDLSTYRNLDRIVRSPVQSLKIEGRMKSPEYVAIVTSIYRKALDAISRGSWSPSRDDELDLALAFNREFTKGYLLGAKDVMGRQMSDNQGVFIGSVAAFDAQRGEAAVRLSGTVVPEQGDGLVFLWPGQEMGLVVQRPHYKDGLLRLRTPERVRPGAKVYLTGSAALSRKAKEIISRAKTQVPIDLYIIWEDGVPLVDARPKSDTGDLHVLVRAGFKMQNAVKCPTTAQQIEAQLRRTGRTPFVIRNVEMNYPGGLFAPLGALNQLRREILANVEQALLEVRRPDRQKIAGAKRHLDNLKLAKMSSPLEGRVPILSVYADSLQAVRGAIRGGCRHIYFEPRLGVQKGRAKRMQELLREAKTICRDAEMIWKWPKITREDFLDFVRPLYAEIVCDGIMVESIGAAEAVVAANPNARIYGASGLNVFNHLTVQALKPTFQLLTLSPELSKDQLARMIALSRQSKSVPALELVVQGNLEVIVSEDCIPWLDEDTDALTFWGLQDFRRIFPLRLDDEKRTHIFNAAETCLLDWMPELFEMGLDRVAVDARGRTEKYAQEMAQIYLKAIEMTEKGEKSLSEGLLALKDSIRPMALGGITSGHFLKGLREELS